MKVYHQGYKVTMIGKLTTPTTFYGSTEWEKPNGELSMVAQTYVRNIETGGVIMAESGSTNILSNFCSIDQNHSSFRGGYAMVRVDFTHNVLYMKPSDATYNYTYPANY